MPLELLTTGYRVLQIGPLGCPSRLLAGGEVGKLTARGLAMNEAQPIRRTYTIFGSASEAEAKFLSILPVAFGKWHCRNIPASGADLQLRWLLANSAGLILAL